MANDEVRKLLESLMVAAYKADMSDGRERANKLIVARLRHDLKATLSVGLEATDDATTAMATLAGAIEIAADLFRMIRPDFDDEQTAKLFEEWNETAKVKES